MKKIIALIALTTTIFAEDKINFNLHTGIWYIDWMQTSTSSDILNPNITGHDVSYTIDNSLAMVLNLNLNYKTLFLDIEYYNNGGALDGIDFDLSLLDLIPFVNFELRYIKANFEGKFFQKPSNLSKEKALQTDNYASSDFETPLEIFDIVVYPFNKYIGVGYRLYNYELPQDTYLIKNSDNSLKQIGSSDLQYSGNFYTLVVDNSKEISSHIDYKGLSYSTIVGVGTLTPKDLKEPELNKYTADSEAIFYDIELGYSYRDSKQFNFSYGLKVGYRYNKITTSSNKTDSEYSLVTEFNSEFYGPFIDISVQY